MIAMCKQMTYTAEELEVAPAHELERTLHAIKQVRDELIGDFWPLVLDQQRQLITNELARRNLCGVKSRQTATIDAGT